MTLLVGVAFAGSKQSPDLASVDPNAEIDVIVQYGTPPSDVQHGRANGWGGKVKKKLPEANAAVYTVRGRDLAGLEEDPDVVYISPDRPVAAYLDYAHSTINANIARSYGWTGAGIGVAVIDSGMYVHPDLDGSDSATNIVYSQDFTGSGSTSDAFGHGTHVAGTLAGNAKTGINWNAFKLFNGVAPYVSIVNLKVLNSAGVGTDSAVISAIDRAIALKGTYNIRVMNLSLGRPIYESYKTDPLCLAAERAWKAGIVVVVAAGNYGRNNLSGNNGYGTVTSPGNDPLVITVGAMKTMSTTSRADDVIASYSSKGPTLGDKVVKPDIVAPGNRIIAASSTTGTLQSSSPGNFVDRSYFMTSLSGTSTYYFRLSGTSMATPMVSGTAALMLHKTPSLTPDQVKARLMKSATKSFPSTATATDPATGKTYVSQHDIFTVGAGYLDTWAALSNTDLAPSTVGAAQSPLAVYNSTSKKVNLVKAGSAIWGSTSGTWSNSAIWGAQILSGTSAIWGSSAVWGASTTQGFSAIWGSANTSGSSAIWGATSPSGTSAIWGAATPANSVLILGEN
jgi:serine protease AprX